MDTKELSKVVQQARLEIGALERGHTLAERPGLQALNALWEEPDFEMILRAKESGAEYVTYIRDAIATQGEGNRPKKTWPMSEVREKKEAIWRLASGAPGNRLLFVLCKWFCDDMDDKITSNRKAEDFLKSSAAEFVKSLHR